MAVGGTDLAVLHAGLNQVLAPERVVATYRGAQPGIGRNLPQRAGAISFHRVIPRARLDAKHQIDSRVVPRERGGIDERVARDDAFPAARTAVVQTVLDQSGGGVERSRAGGDALVERERVAQ